MPEHPPVRHIGVPSDNWKAFGVHGPIHFGDTERLCREIGIPPGDTPEFVAQGYQHGKPLMEELFPWKAPHKRLVNPRAFLPGGTGKRGKFGLAV